MTERVDHRLARAMLEEAYRTFVENVRGVSLGEALHAAGGYRSILGIAKHAAAWSAVYHSYAFEPDPRHWDRTDWPRGLRERIEPTQQYLNEILAWYERSYGRWLASLDETQDLDTRRPVHWGATAPLSEILAMVVAHWAYHAGEINAILAIRRGEAWEYGEEVEENHISTAGHGVRPDWMSDEEAAPFERASTEIEGRRFHGLTDPSAAAHR
jgi:uncharacterized damage-inducible protein DinB